VALPSSPDIELISWGLLMFEKDKINSNQDDRINLSASHVNERPAQKDKVNNKFNDKKQNVDDDDDDSQDACSDD
jgi:hypothetical protein